ncbi:MAG: gliding motility-associated C-terminal domain-containing protein [Lewinellaceae bacterium]|nr:gliding motility-associated C-terminal domain-containing protein [Lewinellaceae bacterium]
MLEDVDAPAVSLDGAGTLTCALTSLTLESEIQTAGASGVWSGPNNFSADTSHISISIPGIYTFHVTAANGCISASTLTVLQDTVPPQSVITQGGLLNCAIQSLAIQAGSSTSASYQWNGPGGFVSSLQMPTVLEPGDYTVTLTGLANGCTATAIATVTQDLSEPDIAVQSDSLTCTTNSVILEATSNTPDVNFAWTGPDNFVSAEEDPLTDKPGVYALTVTGPNGCSTIFQYAVHQNIEHPAVSASADTLSCLEPVGLVISNTPAAEAVFVWSGPGNFTASNAIAAVSAPGLYTVVVTTPNGCSSTAQATVAADTISPVLTAFGGTLTCLDSLVAISATSDVAVTWQWIGPGNFSAQVQAPEVSLPGDYLVSGMAANGCISTSMATVEDDTQAPALGILPPDSLDCATTQVALEALVNTVGSYDFHWTTANGLILSGVNTRTAIATQPGLYTIQVTDLSNGCSAVAEAAVLRNQDIPVGVQLHRRHVSCFGEIDGSVEILSVVGGTAPFAYAIDSLGFTSSHFHPGLTGGIHTLTVLDNNGCTYTTTFQIEELEELLLDLGPDTTIHLGQSIDLNLDGAINYPDRVAETHFVPADLNLPVLLTPLHSFQYHVGIVDSSGCEVWDTRVIIVSKKRWVYIPNIFNPNSLENGLLYVSAGVDVQSVQSFSVFDRWGNAIFNKRDFLPNDPTTGWDGSYRGAAMDPAVFVYYAEVLFIDGETRVYKGDVTLVR